LDHDIVNVNGSGCAQSVTPSPRLARRMVVTMLHELRRRGGTVALCLHVRRRRDGSALVLELL